MTPATATDFGPLIGDVACKLWGAPNKQLSKPDALRWGNQGARIVYPLTGAFKDNEAAQQGGTLDLVQHALGKGKPEAVRWLVEQGFIPDRARDHAIRLDAGQRIVATFEFRKNGVLHYRKHRVEPGRHGRDKDFLYDHPDGAGGWRFKQGDDERIPYRADALAAADLIVIAEGEAKADRLASWGFTATSSKDWRREFAEYVRGKRVVILPDTDAPGAKQADVVRTMIEATAAQVATVTLPRLPVLPDGKGADILDWDGDAAELAVLVEAAFNAPAPAPATFPLIDIAAWANVDPEPRKFTMAGFIPTGETTLATGPGGTGKSLFAQQLATCSAAALAMLGAGVAAGPALYVTAEDDARELHWRQAHICRALRVPIASLAGKLHLVSLRGRQNNELVTFDQQGRLQTTPAFALLKATIAATRAVLVILDNVAHMFAGNENDRGQVTAFANLLNGLCEEFATTIVLIGHPNKNGDDYSGSTAWPNAVRSHFTLKAAEGHDPDARVLALPKANYSRKGQTLEFRWHDHAFILDSDLPDDRRAEMAANVLAAHDNAVFLECLAKRIEWRQAVSASKASRTYAPKEFEAMAEAKGVGAHRLEAAMDRLFRLGAIETGYLWQAHRKPVEGLKPTAPTCGDLCGDVAATPCADVRRQGAATCGDTHPPYYVRDGGALSGPPPSTEADHATDLGDPNTWGAPS